MRSKGKRRAWSLLLVLICCGLSVHFIMRSSATAEPILRLVAGAEAGPVDSVVQQGLPLKAHQHASVAVSQKGQFFLVTGKRGAATGRWEPNPSQLRALSVLVVETEKATTRVVPLKREDGAVVRHVCDFLTASPSGKRWWTGRRRYDTSSDLASGVRSDSFLTAYSEAGEVLQEWVLPTPVDELAFVQAVGEEQACVVDTKQGKLWVYQLGDRQPRGFAYPASWKPAIGASLVTDEGHLWMLHPQGRSGMVEIRVAEINKPSRILATFQWHRKGFTPYLAWHDPKMGLLVFERLREPNNTPPSKIRLDGAKAVYRITAEGVVHKLFETQDVVKTKPGQQVRFGQPLKADEQFVWMEIEYFKGNTPTEYQIVKVPYR